MASIFLKFYRVGLQLALSEKENNSIEIKLWKDFMFLGSYNDVEFVV
jgi:hypothetical protein